MPQARPARFCTAFRRPERFRLRHCKDINMISSFLGGNRHVDQCQFGQCPDPSSHARAAGFDPERLCHAARAAAPVRRPRWGFQLARGHSQGRQCRAQGDPARRPDARFPVRRWSASTCSSPTRPRRSCCSAIIGAPTAQRPRWRLPWLSRTKVSTRIHNVTSDKIKVNDLRGNPIEIATNVVWRVTDTAQALFDVANYTRFVVHPDRKRGARGRRQISL